MRARIARVARVDRSPDPSGRQDMAPSRPSDQLSSNHGAEGAGCSRTRKEHSPSSPSTSRPPTSAPPRSHEDRHWTTLESTNGRRARVTSSRLRLCTVVPEKVADLNTQHLGGSYNSVGPWNGEAQLPSRHSLATCNAKTARQLALSHAGVKPRSAQRARLEPTLARHQSRPYAIPALVRRGPPNRIKTVGAGRPRLGRSRPR